MRSNGDTTSEVRVFSDSTAGRDAATPTIAADNAVVIFGRGTHSYRADVPRDVITNTLDPSAPTLPAIPNYADSTFAVKGGDPVLSPRLSSDGTRLALRSKQIWAARRNMNEPPTISSVDGQPVNEETPVVDIVAGQDTSLSFSYSRSDLESDALSDSAFFLRPDLGMSFTPATRTLSWPVADSPIGAYVVRFQVGEASGGTDYALARIHVRDVTAPAVTTNVSFEVDPNDCTLFHLSWTAPADDSTYSATGPAVEYNIKTSTSSIGTSWTGGLTKSAGAPGSTETEDLTVGAGHSIYVRLKTQDDVGNLSVASNQIHIDGPPVNSDCLGEGGMFVGGGDGGGASLVRAPGATSVRAAEVSGSGTNETSVLNGAVPGAEQQDAFRVTWAASSEGTLATRLREQANEQAWLDAVRLFVVDYSAGLVPYRLGGSFVLGTRQAAAHVTAGNGSDITRSLDSAGAYVAVPGETLRVELGQGAGVLPLLVGTSGQGAVEILVADTLGVCQTHAMLHPRRAFDEVALPAPAADDVRVVCTGSVTVGFLGHLGVSDTQATVHLAELISAEGTRHANVLQAIASVDSLSVTLSGPDTLQLSFSLPEAPAGARDLFLVVDAILGGTQGTRGASMKPTRAEVDPIRFALEQSRPNPSAGKTTIRFALPSTTTVHLEVFDLMGRHVRTLAFGPFLPGYHSIEWDHRDVSGNFVRPGVYLYRLIAGQYRDQKKMVLLAR